MKAYAFIFILSLSSMFLNAVNSEVAALNSISGLAQAPSGTTPQTDLSSAGSFRPGAGTIIVAELIGPIEAKKLKIDDLVECGVTQDLLYQGKIIIPRGARVAGHVAEVTLSSKAQSQSRLGLIFEKIVLKDKRELTFEYPAVVAALAAPIKRGVVPTTRPEEMPVQMQKGRTTGGALIDALDSNASLAGANMPSSKGAIGAANRGVIGVKGLTLEPVGPHGAVILSLKGDVKLVPETQLVLLVVDPTQPK
ncbi:MAG: hypothetical protein JWM08_1586 [Candidatus Angelobacter sp.]|nr:hypothetical protein [Candidatus Angelobacter sp.]